MHNDDYDRFEYLLRRIDELERRLEGGSGDNRGGHRDHRGGPRRDDRRDDRRDGWPGPPRPPRDGRGGPEDEKRIVDLVVSLVTERVEQIVTREVDRAIRELSAKDEG